MENFHYETLVQFLRGRREPVSLAAAQASTADPRFDWVELLKLATTHRVSGLVYDAMEQASPPLPPAAEPLREVYNRTAFHNLYLLNELGEQLNRLKSTGAEVLVLKGAGLAVTAYRTIGLRPMVDMDLLARREQVPALLDALTAAGYRQAVEPRPGAALAFENELSLHKEGLEPLRLDIHWSLFDSLYYQTNLSLDWYWQSARAGDWQGFTIPVPGPEAQLIHLCGHLAFHHARYPSLLWLNDLVEVISAYQDEIDWGTLIQRAADMKLALAVRTYLNEATALGAPIPAGAIDRLRKLAVTPEEQRVFHRHTAKQVRSLSSRVLPDLYEMPTGQRLRYIWVKLLPSPDYMRDRYRDAPVRALPLLYLYHFWVGILAGGSVAINGAWGGVKRWLGLDPERHDG